ncbi:MAG: type II toxin-antitoxin system prevent-host-death family antitoxin [Magnetococcales bacterium]|nr:type II toxin-antitoxin system prevent-host-death family antitoxin [Magnetococcales bacterium]
MIGTSESIGPVVARDHDFRWNEVVQKAFTEGPQFIALQDSRSAVIMSREDYVRLGEHSMRFIEFMRTSPSMGVELELE